MKIQCCVCKCVRENEEGSLWEERSRNVKAIQGYCPECAKAAFAALRDKVGLSQPVC